MEKDLKDLGKKYNLQLDMAIKEIKHKNPNSVLLQFPEAFKPYALSIVDYLEKNLEKNSPMFFISMSSCFGACDIPGTSADLIIQFGHAPWKNNKI